jgi:hypothetical protein
VTSAIEVGVACQAIVNNLVITAVIVLAHEPPSLPISAVTEGHCGDGWAGYLPRRLIDDVPLDCIAQQQIKIFSIVCVDAENLLHLLDQVRYS